MKNLTNDIAEKLHAWIEGKEVQETIKATQQAADTGSFEVVITTENLDRYQEVISLEGWELEHYRSNPVVLWGHDHFTLPIGVCTEIATQDGKMVAKGKFAPHEHAQSIRALYDAGIVRATSVGFIEKEREGNLITKAELLEFSFVSVPANPYALKLDACGLEEVSALVTKGIISLKDTSETSETEPEKDEKDTEDEDVPEEAETVPEKTEEEETTPEAEPSEEQKALAELTAAAVIRQLKDMGVLKDTGALEDAGDSDLERAGVEPETDPEVREFKERRNLQQAVTLLSDVLAERRVENEARRSQ